MKSVRDNIAILLLGTAILMLGQGLLVTLLPVRGDIEGFSTTWIGGMGGAYYIGFAIGCLIGPALIRRVGHIRVYAGFAALTAAATLTYQLTPEPLAWVATRGISGACFAVLFMSIESWLNEQSTNQTRGKILSLYIIITNLVTMGGQLMLNLADPASATPFIVCAMLICLSLVPISLSKISEPTAPPTARLNVRALYKLSPVGFVGCLIFGVVDGSFWSLGPVFAQDRGFSIAGITFFMSAFMLGGTLLQWPIGWISDRIDRRIMIAGCCFGTIGTGLSLAFLQTHEGMVPFIMACLHGGFMFPLYGLILAHANDFAPQEKLVETSGGLLLVYGIGAATGPFLVAPLMETVDAGYLFLTMAVLFAGLAGFSLIRIIARPITADIDRSTFVPLTRGSQAIYELEAEDEDEPDYTV
jgi:MFS family permease